MYSPDVTEALAAMQDGDGDARDRLVRAVYSELHEIARAYLRQERAGHTLVTTALVHEAYERVLTPCATYNGRGHFFGAAARAMRQILVQHARRRGRVKRGSGERPLALTEVGDIAAPEAGGVDVLDLDDALTRLADFDARQAAVVECRYFGGLSVEETAEALSISDSTVKREWRTARAWLYAVLHDESEEA